MDWSVKVGALSGITIKLHITILFFLLPALQQIHGAGFWLMVEYAVAVVLSILIHELGHALTAKRFGQRDLLIMLHGFGGFASSTGSQKPTQRLLVVLAGPAATFALGLVCLLISNSGLQSQSLSYEATTQLWLLHQIGRLNIFLGFLNLIPCFPWDGGLAVAAILSYRMSELKGLRYVAHYSLLFGPALAIYGFATHSDFLIIFGLIGGLSSYMLLADSGGIRFGEARHERKAKKEEEAYKKRVKAKADAFLDEVTARSIEREEQERLRKLLG